MRTAIATVCLSGTLPEKLEAIAAAKFKGVEIFENDLLSFNGTPAEVRRMAAELGLEIITFQPFRDFEGMPEPHRGKALSRAERKFDVMAELGCDLLLVCSNVSPDALGGVDRAAADFRELGERAAKRGLRVGYEALAWGRHVSDYRDAWEVVRRADHPSVGLILDSFHILARKTDLTPMRAIPKDRIFLVQLADAPLLEMDYLSWSRHYRSFPGQGELAVDAFMDALQATGYDGLLSHEIFNDRFRAGSARSVAIDGQRSLIFMLDELRRRTGTAVPGLPALPPRAACAGVEFVEFADGPDRGRRFREAARRARLRQGGRAQVEGRRPLAPGRHQHHRQPREGRLRPFLQHHAWLRGLRDRAEGRRRLGDDRARREAARPAVPPGRSGRASSRSRRCAASAAASSTSSIGQSAPSGIWDVDFDPVAARSRRRGGGPRPLRPHLAVDARRGDADLASVLHLASRPR